MIVLRWAAVVVFLICLIVGAEGVCDWALAGIAFVAFLVVCWTLRGTDRPACERGPVSNFLVAEIDQDHPDGLGSFDLRDRGLRRPDEPPRHHP